MEIHEKVRELMQQSGSRIMSVTFYKRDGSTRTLTFNPRHVGEITGNGSEIRDPEKRKNIIRVMDIHKKLNAVERGWRSFDARTVISITVNKNTIQFTEE